MTTLFYRRNVWCVSIYQTTAQFGEERNGSRSGKRGSCRKKRDIVNTVYDTFPNLLCLPMKRSMPSQQIYHRWTAGDSVVECHMTVILWNL